MISDRRGNTGGILELGCMAKFHKPLYFPYTASWPVIMVHMVFHVNFLCSKSVPISRMKDSDRLSSSQALSSKQIPYKRHDCINV